MEIRMNKIFAIIGLLSVTLAGQAATIGRSVVMDTVCHCSPARWQEVVDKFFLEFQSDADHLFTWAYLNTGGDGDSSSGGKDAIALHYGANTYDRVNKVGDQAFDIYVLGSKMFPDRHLGTINHGQYMTATYSGSMLKGANIQLLSDSIAPNKTKVHYEFNLYLGHFLSLIISEKTWNNVADWRLRQIFANLVEYAETGTVIDRSKKK